MRISYVIRSTHTYIDFDTYITFKGVAPFIIKSYKCLGIWMDGYSSHYLTTILSFINQHQSSPRSNLFVVEQPRAAALLELLPHEVEVRLRELVELVLQPPHLRVLHLGDRLRRGRLLEYFKNSL